MKDIKVDLLAHEKHFFDHLAPMFAAVPREYRGSIIVPDTLRKYVLDSPYSFRPTDIDFYTGVRRHAIAKMQKSRRNLVLCSASGDQIHAARANKWTIFTQHGAGQSFNKKQSSYAGFAGRSYVGALLYPGDNPADKDRPLYPDAGVYVIGCPKLDPWHSGELEQPKNDRPVVVFSSHWDCKVVPETRSAFYHMLPGLDALASLSGTEFDLFGHGHPRSLHQFVPEYRKRKVPVIRNFADVMKRADLYIMDHMSTLYEFAAAGPGGHGRPVVVLNDPRYRRGVEHGLRFWSAAHVGLNCDRPDDLVDVVREALKDTAKAKQNRFDAVQMVYKYTDGKASERAGHAIVETIERFRSNSIKQNKSVSFRQPLIKTMAMQKGNLVQLIANNRLRNAQKGYTPKGKRVVEGIDVRPGRTFWTDKFHGKDLVRLGHAREPEAGEFIPFPGDDVKVEAPKRIEKVTKKHVPEFDSKHRGGGYYEITEDGVVIEQVYGKDETAERIRQLTVDWKMENEVPLDENEMDLAPADYEPEL